MQIMDWPAISPDLNSIERVWDLLGKYIQKRPNIPKALLQFEEDLIKEWESILLKKIFEESQGACQQSIMK